MNKVGATAVYLAAYSDHELKTGLKTAKAEEVDERLSALIDLFVCLQDRDAFLNQYKKHLAERLINKNFLAMEFEESMLSKLKLEVGIN